MSEANCRRFSKVKSVDPSQAQCRPLPCLRGLEVSLGAGFGVGEGPATSSRDAHGLLSGTAAALLVPRGCPAGGS